MITLLSSLLGFAGAMLPDLLAIFRECSDRQYEKDMLEMQLKQQALGLTERLDEVRLEQAGAERQALYRTWASGVKWVDALNGSVRPVLAYAFFLLYATTKCLQFNQHPSPLPWLLWGEEDQAIFAGIISFYFGQRAFQKTRK